jgi:cytochrome c5
MTRLSGILRRNNMALSRTAASLGFAGLAALTLVVIGRPDDRDWAAAEAERPVAASTTPGQVQAVAPSPAPTKVSAAGIALQSVNVDLPDRGIMFPGPGSDAINNNCLACHSAGMVINQPPLPRAAWAAEVNKMINAYKAPVAPEDVAAIVDYLANVKGAK